MFENIYKNKKVVVTGHTGFKGSWMTLWLHKLGAKIYGISNNIPTNPSMFIGLDLKKKITHYNCDIRDLKKTKQIIETINPDFVFHLAAQALVSVSYKSPVETISTNVIGTTNILESLKSLNNKCIGIIITSDKCYDNVEWVWGYKETDNIGGKDIYSGSKGAAELIINSYYNSFFKNLNSNIRIASARAGNVIGGGDWAIDRIIPDCIRAWSTNNIVEIRSPEATRPWQHVLEPLSGYLTLGLQLSKENELNGESFNFGPLSQYSKKVIDLIEDISKIWGKKGRKFYEVTENIKFHEAGLLKLNCDKALLKLKWIPTLNYEKLVEFTGMWYSEFYKEESNMIEYTKRQISEYENIAKNKGIKWAIQD